MFYRIVAGGSKGLRGKRESDVTAALMRRSRMDLLDAGASLMCFCGIGAATGSGHTMAMTMLTRTTSKTKTVTAAKTAAKTAA